MDMPQATKIGNWLLRKAAARYDGYPGHREEAIVVARCVGGDVGYIDNVLAAWKAGTIEPGTITDPYLWSLLTTILSWREHSVSGDLPDTIPAFPTTVADWTIDLLRDVLLMAGMYEREYEWPQQSSLSIEPHVLQGWDYRGLAELFAIDYQRK